MGTTENDSVMDLDYMDWVIATNVVICQAVNLLILSVIVDVLYYGHIWINEVLFITQNITVMY